MALPVALGLYTVRDLYREDLAGCLRLTAELGYAGAECFGPPTLPAGEVRAAFEAAGLALVGWHLPIETLEGDALTETVAYLREVGCTRAVVPWLPSELFRQREQVIAVAARLEAIASALSAEGIALGYHNHEAEFKPFDEGGELPWDLLMTTATGIFGQLDTGNAMASGVQGIDPAQLILRYPGRAQTIHAKPYSSEKGFAVMIGEDQTDWRSLINAAEQTGCSWIIIEFEDAMLSQEDGAAQSIEALLKFL